MPTVVAYKKIAVLNAQVKVVLRLILFIQYQLSILDYY